MKTFAWEGELDREKLKAGLAGPSDAEAILKAAEMGALPAD